MVPADGPPLISLIADMGHTSEAFCNYLWIAEVESELTQRIAKNLNSPTMRTPMGCGIVERFSRNQAASTCYHAI